MKPKSKSEIYFGKYFFSLSIKGWELVALASFPPPNPPLEVIM